MIVNLNKSRRDCCILFFISHAESVSNYSLTRIAAAQRKIYFVSCTAQQEREGNLVKYK